MATVDPYQIDYEDYEILNEFMDGALNLRRRWELGEIDIDDLDNGTVSMKINSMGAFAEAQIAVNKPDSDDSLEATEFLESEILYGLHTCEVAAWELADLGEFTLATQLLVKVAHAEYGNTYQSDYYIPAPDDFSY